MANNKKFSEFMKAVNAVQPGTTSAALSASSIDATGYQRATFIFQFGTPSNASCWMSSADFVYNAATSGATYTAITGAGPTTNLTTGAYSNANLIVDVAINRAKPWLKISGQIMSSLWPVACLAVLSNPDSRPPTAGSAKVVSV